jgi:hypothetical protein
VLTRGWQVIRSSTSVGTTIVSGSDSYLSTASFSNPNLNLTSTGLGFSGNVNLSSLVPTSASYAISSSRATNASNIGITDNPSFGSVTYYPTFVGQTSGFTNVLVDSATFTYNPNTNILNTTSSWALTASYALNVPPNTGFPFTGSAEITGSLGVTGSISVTSGSYSGSVINNITDTYTSTPKVNNIVTLTSVQWTSISSSADSNTLYIII